MYYKYLSKNVTEVLVQFKDEEPAWIPLSTYEAIPCIISQVKKVGIGMVN